MANNRVSNVWKKLQLFCTRHEGTPEKIKLVSNDEKVKEPYFICSCEDCVNADYKNRITLKDYESLDLKIESHMCELGLGFDLTNYSFKLKRTGSQSELSVKVMEYSGKAIKLGIH